MLDRERWRKMEKRKITGREKKAAAGGEMSEKNNKQ